MSHCKACDTPLEVGAMKLSPLADGADVIMPDEEEDLCYTCLESARESFYYSIGLTPEQGESLVRHYFYHNDTSQEDKLIESLTKGSGDVTLIVEDV